MTGWIAVQLDVKIDYDLENSPLQIRTDSVIGSNEKVEVYFYDAQGSRVGGVSLKFSSSVRYWLSSCSRSWTDLLTTLPLETDKVWTITLTRSSDTPSVVIHCNNNEVLNVVMSDIGTCGISNWRQYWSKDVEKIMFFSSYDTASDYYRPGKVMTSCVFENYLNRIVYPVQIYYTF